MFSYKSNSLLSEEMSLPLVSIVTPSYNQGHYIKETIESVLTQDYPNIEFWVIDGGSTDETISILQEYEQDSRFHWISEPDNGQSNAINKGWKLCKGDIITWLNSDDTYLPGAIQTQVNALLSHPDYGAVYGDGIFIDEKGKEIYRCHASSYSLLELLRITIPLQPTVFIRRNIVNEVGLINENYKYSMDSEYWVRVAKVTNFWHEQKFIATYRLHDNSKTIANYSGFYNDWLSIADNFFEEPTASNIANLDRFKQQVYGGIYGRIATIEAEKGLVREAIKYLCRSIYLVGFRTRSFKTVMLLIERLFPFKFISKFVELWTVMRSLFQMNHEGHKEHEGIRVRK
jgi:glycosyltransferase involved in cell wall biosynthesis